MESEVIIHNGPTQTINDPHLFPDPPLMPSCPIPPQPQTRSSPAASACQPPCLSRFTRASETLGHPCNRVQADRKDSERGKVSKLRRGKTLRAIQSTQKPALPRSPGQENYRPPLRPPSTCSCLGETRYTRPLFHGHLALLPGYRYYYRS